MTGAYLQGVSLVLHVDHRTLTVRTPPDVGDLSHEPLSWLLVMSPGLWLWQTQVEGAPPGA